MSTQIILVAGSSRVDSQSAKVAHYLAGRLRRREVTCEVLDLGREPLPLWPGAEPVTTWPGIAERLRQAEALVVLSPEWNGMACPALKNFFLYAGRAELAHKPALLVGVSSGRRRLSALRAARLQLQELPHLLHSRAADRAPGRGGDER